MLTRLEVDGFKNLLGFSCELGPYTCIAGPNAAGKSNIFDAISFLSLLADYSFMDAAQRLRSDGPRGGDPRSLFWGNAEDLTPRMSFAVEMIVPGEVEDDFGIRAKPTTTFLRYELILQYQPPTADGASRTGLVRLIKEGLTYIPAGEAKGHLSWPHSKKDWRDHTVGGRRRNGVPYISTKEGEGIVLVHQDGGSRGQPRKSPIDRAPRTTVSGTTSADDPTILAARREMQQWQLLALEPAAMRSPDSVTDSARVMSNGSHLPSTLFRMAAEQGSDIFAEVASTASALVDLREIRVDHDRTRELLTLEGRLGGGPMLPARSFSDGTLRFLALCVIGLDETGGLLCMEEPENGIHPGRIESMVELVRGLAVDPWEIPGVGNSFRQVVVNTHSPFFVQYQHQDDLVLALPVVIQRDNRLCTTVKLIPLARSWRSLREGTGMSKAAISEYLINPPDAPLTLDLALGEAS